MRKRSLPGAKVSTWRTTGPPNDDPVATSRLGAWGSRPEVLQTGVRPAKGERRKKGHGRVMVRLWIQTTRTWGKNREGGTRGETALESSHNKPRDGMIPNLQRKEVKDKCMWIQITCIDKNIVRYRTSSIEYSILKR